MMTSWPWKRPQHHYPFVSRDQDHQDPAMRRSTVFFVLLGLQAAEQTASLLTI